MAYADTLVQAIWGIMSCLTGAATTYVAMY